MKHKCCEGVRAAKFSRRYFLKRGGIALVGMSTLPAFLQRAVAATAMPKPRTKEALVVLFQRGAADGLNIVVPFAEPNYYRIRPSIAIPAPRQGADGSAPGFRRFLRFASQPRGAGSLVSENSNWRSCTPRGRPIPRDRILMRKITWSRALRALRRPRTAG